MKTKTNFMLMFFLLIFISGCSKAVMDEIDGMLKANFGNYTKEEPLTIFVMPFKPALELDPESVIGLIAWNGAVQGVESSAFFSEGKIVNRGLVDSGEYLDILRTDDFWDDLGKGEGIKETLREAADDYNSNAIIYGLYYGSETELRLTVYFFSRRDDIVLKQKTYVKSTLPALRELVRKVKYEEQLSASQVSLMEMIEEKVHVVTVKLVRKYVEGV